MKLKRSEVQLEVRYAETDQMGVVHHSSYVIWCEVGRTKLIELIGFNYAEMEKTGIVSPVTNIDLSYKYPTFYGQTVTVYTWVKAYDGVRVTYGYEIVNNDGVLCVTGTSTHVCVKKGNFRPVSIRKMLPDWHEAYMKLIEE